MALLRNFIMLVHLLLLFPNFISGSRILLIPLNIQSHILSFSRVGQALTLQGDEVTLLAASNARVPSWINDANITVLKYKVQDSVPFMQSEEFSQLVINAALSQSTFEKVRHLYTLIKALTPHLDSECVDLLEDKEIRSAVIKENFDMAFVDLAGWSCMYVYPYVHNIPYATLSIRVHGWIYRIPAMSSFVPSMLSAYSDHMTFFQRLQNVCLDMLPNSLFNRTTHFVEKYAKDKELLETTELIMRQKLWLFLDDITTAYSYPSMPNTLSVGDIIPQPANQLPSNLKQLVDISEHGCVVVSFGTVIEQLPENLIEIFCTVFKSLKQTFIWKLGDEKLCVGDNIHILSWIPQNDLLGHPNVKLFINHAGANGLLESVYHATPMLVLPITGDGPFNAGIVENKGYGLRMELTDITRDGLTAKIHQVLTNTRYLTSIRKASAIMKNKPIPTGQRLSFLVNHVTKYGDDHLRTGAYKLNAMQFYMLDIFAFVLGAATIILIVMLCTLRCFCRCMFRCCCGSKQTLGKLKSE